jgi:hypothetical protein
LRRSQRRPSSARVLLSDGALWQRGKHLMNAQAVEGSF